MIAYANYFTDARIKNYVEALVKEGFEVDVFALGGGGGAHQTGVRFFSVMGKYWGSSSLRYAFAQLLFVLRATVLVASQFLRKRYCLVHVHNIPNFLVYSALVPKLGGARVILDVHDTMPEAYATKFDLPLDHPLIALLRWEERLSAGLADLVITTNELHKEVLCGHGIAPGKIDIILNAANKRLFRPVEHRVEPHKDGLLLAYHGTIAARLGIDLILRAMVLASTECPDVRLLLIGDGDFLDTVKTLVNDWDLSDRVEVMGFVPVEELATHLGNTDVGIVGNRGYTEAKQNYMLPVKMLEYAAMEIPTIAPRLRVIRQYFDESSAIYYATDDAEDMARRIVEIHRDRDIITRARQGLRFFNQRYNWSAMERKYVGIVVRLLGEAMQATA